MQMRLKQKITVDEFLAWAEENPGRYELVDGEILAMAPQRLGHADAKYAFQTALRAGIEKSGAALPYGTRWRDGARERNHRLRA